MKKIIALFLTMAMVMALAACAPDEDPTKTDPETTVSDPETTKEPVKIHFPTYAVGTHVSAPWQTKVLERFEEEYGDRIEVVVEEIPSDDAYYEKLKVLLAARDMPDLIIGGGGMDLLTIEAELAVDVKPYLDADPEWKEDIGEQGIEKYTYNGAVYAVPHYRTAIGYFYNKEMFEAADIRPAQTWDEWMDNLDKLKEAGYVPLALMTGENAWTTNLILGAIIGSSGEAGNRFMNTMHPTDFEIPEVINALEMIKTMLIDYTIPDAIGAPYTVAANSFLSEEAAIIANGPWMAGDFDDPEKVADDFYDKVGASIFPKGIHSALGSGMLVTAQTQEKADAAAKLLKFHTDAVAQQWNLEMQHFTPLSPRVEAPEDYMEENPIISELINMLPEAEYEYVHFSEIFHSNVVDQFAVLYPTFVADRMTAEEMAEELTEAAKRN